MVDKSELRIQFAKEWEKHYKVRFLVDTGFVRKQCLNCKKHFWTLDTNRTVCADSNCFGYEFIGKPTKKLDYVQTWKEIEKYFNKNDHVSIPRYPVVCRWRDDLYFTNASIIDFQPYVVTGEIEPPANPLIVPQHCLRFGDIENVGVTGRHYSGFVMFGQHAFNSEKTGLFYWKNEALEHDFNYLTKILGAKKEDITFIEDVWAGGGTFGPSIEYCVNGIELGNCVFMQFKETENGKYEELKTKVIDMGAGLERLAWFTNGTPTSYDITFETVLKKMKARSGIKPDMKLFEKYAKVSGILDVESQAVKQERELIAKKLGVDEKELFDMLRPMQAMYACADHLKTILYAVTDGMLPSNSGGGYNIRMLVRRVLGFNQEFNLNLDYAEIISEHAKFLEDFDDSLLDMVPTTVDVLEEEIKKYSKSREQGTKKLESLFKKPEQLTEKKLMELYESDGIPIEFVEEQAKRQKIPVRIPENFYGNIALKNEIQKEKIKMVYSEFNYPKTKELFYEDQYLTNCTAQVLGVLDNSVILDQTILYPEGGGQDCDLGFINEIKVLDVQRKEGIILHLVEKPEKFKKGQKVTVELDVPRRKALMFHHSATHLINAACKHVLGPHVWQAGAHKKVDEAHLDITHYRHVTDEELERIERMANELVQKDLKVKIDFIPRNKAEEAHGFGLYQGGYVPGKTLRVVNMQDQSIEACGGTHVGHTAEVGLIKIVKRESKQDGIERLTFVAGLAALSKWQEQERWLKKSAENLAVPVHDLPKATQRFFEEWKDFKKKSRNLSEKLLDVQAQEISESKEVVVQKYLEDIDSDLLFDLGLKIIEKNPKKHLILGAGSFLVIACGKDSGKNANLELQNYLKKLGGKGGGSPLIARAQIDSAEKLRQFFLNKTN
ncbi:MAG: alanine--tRNA ligase [Candidatus Diapherotrites archaeon]|nr:alanine--tRNA ligase [Candidatus Diapherotrites archaeon]